MKRQSKQLSLFDIISINKHAKLKLADSVRTANDISTTVESVVQSIPLADLPGQASKSSVDFASTTAFATFATNDATVSVQYVESVRLPLPVPSQSHVQSLHIVEPVNVRELKKQIGTTTSAVFMPFGEATSNASAHANAEQIPTAYPSCCTVEQYDYVTKEHNWITVRNGKLGCSVCKTLGSLGASTVGVG